MAWLRCKGKVSSTLWLVRDGVGEKVVWTINKRDWDGANTYGRSTTQILTGSGGIASTTTQALSYGGANTQGIDVTDYNTLVIKGSVTLPSTSTTTNYERCRLSIWNSATGTTSCPYISLSTSRGQTVSFEKTYDLSSLSGTKYFDISFQTNVSNKTSKIAISEFYLAK